MNEVELKVKGMSCSHCEMRVKKASEKVEGVKEARAGGVNNWCKMA